MEINRNVKGENYTSHSLVYEFLRSFTGFNPLSRSINDKFSFVVTIHFLQKKWEEAVEISREFNLSDLVLNSYDLPYK